MRYSRERTILMTTYGVLILLLFNFVPRDKLREASVSFLFKQIITWLFGLLVVEKGLISYPFRLFFKKSNKSSFSFEYFIFPSLCVFFNLYFPEQRHRLVKLSYYFLHTSLLTGLETLALKYTKLIEYKKWTWYWSFITIWISYYISHTYYRWFFKIKN